MPAARTLNLTMKGFKTEINITFSAPPPPTKQLRWRIYPCTPLAPARLPHPSPPTGVGFHGDQCARNMQESRSDDRVCSPLNQRPVSCGGMTNTPYVIAHDARTRTLSHNNISKWKKGIS